MLRKTFFFVTLILFLGSMYSYNLYQPPLRPVPLTQGVQSQQYHVAYQNYNKIRGLNDIVLFVLLILFVGCIFYSAIFQKNVDARFTKKELTMWLVATGVWLIGANLPLIQFIFIWPITGLVYLTVGGSYNGEFYLMPKLFHYSDFQMWFEGLAGWTFGICLIMIFTFIFISALRYLRRKQNRNNSLQIKL